MPNYYVSGPINAPVHGKEPSPELVQTRKNNLAFVAEKIKRPGREVINPVDITACGWQRNCGGAESGRHTWNCYLRYDIRELTMCDYIVLLEGWENSPGARLELKVSLMLGICPLFWSNHEVQWWPGPINTEAQALFENYKKAAWIES